jgi:hypothetical protein
MNKSFAMKKLLPALIFILLSLPTFADWDMMFCDSVNQKADCIGKAAVFQLAGTDLQLTVMLLNLQGLRTAKVYFEIYRMDPATFAEDLVYTEEAKTEPIQASVYQTFHILQKGHYLVKARDAFKDYITSRELEVR